MRPVDVEIERCSRVKIKTILDAAATPGPENLEYLLNLNKEITLKGWVKSIRKSKTFCFIVLNDGSTQENLQVIADQQKITNYEEISQMIMGYCIAVKGILVASQGKGQKVELQATELTILGAVDERYPLQKKSTSLEFLRENAHLRHRSNTFSAVFRVRHHLAMATHQFFHERGFYYLNSPIITGSDCEGAGEMFHVTTLNLKNVPKLPTGEVDFNQDFFGKPTYLTVSGQLAGECFALGLGNVYTFGPTFRAENSNTTRHLAEFWMVEPEVAFADLDEIAELAADYLKHLIGHTLKHCPHELEFFQQFFDKGLINNLTNVYQSEFLKITYTEAVHILEEASKKHTFSYPVTWGQDLQTEHERYLTEVHFNRPVIVTDYPKMIKAFYMKANDDGKTVRAMDVLVPGVGELMGGSQREDNEEKLLTRLTEVGLKEEDYWWYLDLRRQGGTPHSGFGLGFERAVMYITGMSNIRDVIPFPRTPKNADF